MIRLNESLMDEIYPSQMAKQAVSTFALRCDNLVR